MTTTDVLSLSAKRVTTAASDLGAPWSSAWPGLARCAVPLEPTPLDAQPSSYVQRAWASRPYGATQQASLSAAVSDGTLFVRVEWPAPEPVFTINDNDVFADACALLFPLDGVTAELSTMGSESAPVQGWYWRAGAAETYAIVAKGLGTAERQRDHGVEATSEWKDGAWGVVFARALDAPGVPIGSGALPMGCAIWTGAAGERAGLKAHSPNWLQLAIEGGGA